MTTALKVPAAAMRPGDVTTGSKQTIVSVESHGLNVPPGKVWVTTRALGATLTRKRLWGARTLIGIEREETP